ncbi:MAG: hypothetical protein VX438_16050 [Planctomycetota bacterium]|nr:hypothetical protein [Planctomycetota bacterium]
MQAIAKPVLLSFALVLLCGSYNHRSSWSQEETKSKEDAKLVSALPSGTKSEQLRKKYAYLKPRIESILRFYFQQKEHAEKRSPWGIMHAMVAYGPYAEMYGDGALVKDVDWLCDNRKCRGWQLLNLHNGTLGTNNGPGRQGHDGQFLMVLAFSQVPQTKPLRVGRKQFTIDDLIKYEMETCKPRTELTFKLIGLAHYLDSDTQWKSKDGQAWNLERILKEELNQSINGAACGGTHRLTGYSYALLMRKLQEKEIKGEWARAEEFLAGFQRYAFSMQNRDGSFSTDWFKRRQAQNNSQRRLQTTGHILEWLVFLATESELENPRLIKAVDYLSTLMWNERNTQWAVGPKGHAIRALRLFYERVLVEPSAQVAQNAIWTGQNAVLQR